MSNILSQGSWWIINKKLTQKIGLDASFLLSDLITRYEHWKDKGKLDDGFFFCLKEDIQADTTITGYRQTEAIKVLIKIGFIEVKKKGIPAKNFYKINTSYLNKVVFELNEKH